MSRRAIPLAVLRFTLTCALACGGAPRPASQAAMPDAPWNVTYADGAANVYSFAQPSPGAAVVFAYDPVTPERSSTGQYSGGDPVNASLPAGDPRLAELWRRLEALAADRALHTAARDKGTGAFHLVSRAGERAFIVSSGAALADFHTFVTSFRR